MVKLWEKGNWQEGVWYAPVAQPSGGWPDTPPKPEGYRIVVERDAYLGIVTKFKLEKEHG